jgi:hypothetical protein
MALTSTVVRAGGFMVSEAEGFRSREMITVLSGEVLKAGHVVEAVLVGASAAATAATGNVGDGAMGAITVSNAAREGDYQLVITEPGSNVGEFEVRRVGDGELVGQGTVAAAFSAGGLAFTLADGATDFAVGDSFMIAVSAGGYKYREYDPTNADAAIAPAGILWDAIDASAADTKGAAVVRDCEVNDGELTWFSGASAGQKAAAFQAMKDNLGVIARTAI